MKTGKENIREELKTMAPELAKLAEKNPFLLPENYFEDKAESLFGNARVQAFIDAGNSADAFTLPEGYFNDLSGKILDRLEFENDIPEEKPADLPDHYFETLPGNVMARILRVNVAEKKSPGKIAWLTWPRAAAIAAAFAGVIITFALFTKLNLFNTPNPVSNIDQVPTTELQAYVESNLQAISSDNLETVWPEDNFTFDDSDLPEEVIETEELREYLKEDIDLSTIEDML